MSELKPDPAAPAVEKLGELPAAYHDDALVLLIRNPRTLFAYWDYAPGTIAAAFEGLDSPRAVMRLFDGGRLARELDIAIEPCNWYVSGVEPDREYRVEIHAVGVDGKSRRLGRSSAQVSVPPPQPSSTVEDRFVRIPWDLPLARAADVAAHDGAPVPLTHEQAAALSPSEPVGSDYPGRPWSGAVKSGGL